MRYYLKGYVFMLKKSSVLILMLLYVLCDFFTKKVYAETLTTAIQWQMKTMTGAPSLRGSAIIKNSLWVTGSNNAVFVSQDGGMTWLNKSVNSSIKTDFRDIELFDNNTAIVMGIGSGEQSVLFKTTDGGNNWQKLYQNKHAEGFFDSIAFWDKNVGLLMGDPVDGYYDIKKTVDGGKTWRRINKNKLPKFLKKEAAFAASGNTLIVGKDGNAWLTTGGFSASVYMSSDFGENWQRHSVPLFSDTETAGGYGLALNAERQLFVVGGDYLQRSAKYPNIATFSDHKWQPINSGQHGLRTAMSCQNNTCIATGKLSSDISFDGGKTWQKVLAPNQKNNAQGFYTLASDQQIFLAAGPQGKVGILRLP
jgi:photosystem II stability/assembly factor-like uncharacterized protein